MSEKLPLISILVCNYNYGSFILEALESVLEQDYSNIEIIIVDDASSDNSVELIQKFIANNPVKTIRLDAKKKNEGTCYARNTAINMANGDYVLFLDSDDTLPVSYVSALYDVAQKTRADVVYGDEKTFGSENRTSDHPKFNRDELLIHNYINVSSLIKKDRLGDHRFDLSLNRKRLEDYDFWVGLALADLKFVKAKDVYLNYRIQAKSRNENVIDMKTQQLRFIEIWEYILTKYQAQYPKIVTREVFVAETKNQINVIGGELFSLNKVVQEELLPELHKRAEHIAHLDARINDLEISRNALHGSISYRVGRVVTAPIRSLLRKKSI